MSIFDGLLSPTAPVDAFYGGLERGKAEREEREVKGALSAYVSNPDDPRAFQALAQYKPEFALKIREDQRKRQLLERTQGLQQRAAQGDKGAMAELAGIDLDAWSKLDKVSQDHFKQRTDFIGQSALAIQQLPPEQRPAAWDHYIDQGVMAGYSDLAQLKGQYSPEALDGAIAQAGLVKEALGLAEPKYQVIPEGGTLVNTRSPDAVRSFQQGGQGPTTTKTLNGKTYYNIGGKWFDEPQGGAGGNVSSNFLDGL